MLLRGNYIGQQCAKPNHELQTTLHPTTASVLKLGRSPLAPVHRGVSPAYTKSVDRSAQVDVSSAAASSQSMIAENDATSRVRGEATQETVDLAILWACQHGLVSDNLFCISEVAICCLIT